MPISKYEQEPPSVVASWILIVLALVFVAFIDKLCGCAN